MRTAILFFISLLVFVGCTINPKYENQINKILDWEANNGCFTDEQFDAVFKIIENNPKTFSYDFSYHYSPDEIHLWGQSKIRHMDFVESNDKMVRAYILERHGFEGNPSWGFEFSTLIQYSIDTKIYTYRMPTDCIIEEIAALSDNKYLFISYYGGTQGVNNYRQANVYSISEEGVHLLSKAFEHDGKYLEEISVYWDGGVSESYEDYEEEEEYYDENRNHGVAFNYFDKILYVSNTVEKNYVLLDGTFRRYSWDGDRFRDVTIMKPYEVKNKDYYIRIEQNKDGSCTYKCWNGGIKSGKPSLTIYGGTRERWYELGFMNYDEWISLDEYQPLGERYTFTNNGYTYQYMTGWYKGHMYENLDVYNPNGTLIYSKDFDIVSQNEYE